jgi:hypothetical protein
MTGKQQLSIILFLFAVLVLTASSACKKDDDPSQTKTEMITGKNFFLKVWTIDPGFTYQGNVITDLFFTIPECSRDDFFVFNADGSITFNEGEVKCDEGAPQTATGSWSFLDNETKLKLIYGDGSTKTFYINGISDGTLALSYDFTDDLGDGQKSYTYSYTYSAI